jgi:hypothetical protein
MLHCWVEILGKVEVYARLTEEFGNELYLLTFLTTLLEG